eukprot:TRINITY_DN2989_c0_g1_i1.p1 TRINITY_DN2989_c0_g1~~TRINITY_DN2989_c0_g1_i1.p1  ORF type:complete len:667 (-),score=152.82 TRINITY_DN2989_c0_g1_i1:49-2049(-)
MQKVLALLALFVLASLCLASSNDEEQIEAFFRLEKLKNLGLLNEAEYLATKQRLLDSYLKIRNHKHAVTNLSYSAYGNNTIVLSDQAVWLIKQFNLGMPRSYDDVIPYTGDSFWHSEKYLNVGAFSPTGEKLKYDDQIAIQERALTHTGLNLYDGAVWGVALTLVGAHEYVDVYHRGVLYSSSTGANPTVDGLVSIRADKPEYYYGKSQISGPALAEVTLPDNMTQVYNQDPNCCGDCCEQTSTNRIPGSYFYRMIGPTYRMNDPLGGNYGWTWKAPPAGPNNDSSTKWNLAGIIHWNDWKPITGENVWAIILGPLQMLWIKNCTNITKFTTFKDAPPELQLALSIIPALQALQSPLGSMYHCPKGTQMFPADPSEETNVSNENNFSAYASFILLQYYLKTFAAGTSDPVLTNALTVVNSLVQGLQQWFSTQLLSVHPIDGEYVIYQGGHVTFDGQFLPQEGPQAFAVDCQTWGLTVVGAPFFDQHYGQGRAMSVWRSTKKLAGFYLNGQLAGVGYTVYNSSNANQTNLIWSGEWSWGAVNMCRKLAREYTAMGNTAYAAELMADAQSMIANIKKPMIPCRDGTWCGGGLVQVDGSLLYANDRFFIPWGWYANPIGATSSTGWSVMNDYLYNPFEIGGGPNSTWVQARCNGNAPYWDHAMEYFGLV